MDSELSTSTLVNTSPWSKHSVKITASQSSRDSTILANTIIEKSKPVVALIPRAYHSSSKAATSSGEIYIFGGVLDGVTKNDTWAIKISEDRDSLRRAKLGPAQLSVTASLMGTTGEAPSPRIGHGSGLAGNWLIVWGGGTYENDQFVRTDCCTYFLNLTTRHWTKLDIQPAPGARLAHATCVYGNRFIVFGGSGTENDSGPRNDLWSLDIDLLTRETPRWERIEVATESEVPSERMGHTMLAYENRLYIFGGRHCPNHMWKDTWYFDMDIRVWNRVACTSNCPPARGNFSATLVQDKMYIFGGYDDQKQLGDTWCFNISEQQWYNFPSMDYEPSPRSGHTLATIGKRVLAIGGSAQGGLSPEMRTFVHVFNSDLISFSELGTGPQLISRDEWSGSTRIGDALEGDTHAIHSDRHDSSLDELVTGVENLEAGVSEARNEADFGPDKGNKPDTITRAMSATEILHYLIEHGCRDISKELIISHISDYPMSFGGFGDVYCATLQNGDRVGIKCVRMLTNSTSEGKKLLKSAAHELYVWSKCKHPNVIELLGVMLFRDQIAMVSPWLENGHLRAFLSHKSQVDRCALCVQIADGVAYLHQKSIIHGDLKPENILISKDHNPKLTDFGNSALAEYTLQFTHSSTVQGMSLRWAAPEIIEEESKPTQASDVYALGMIIYEVISREMPYAGAKDSAIVFKVVAGTKPTRPKTHIPTEIEQADRLWSMLIRCWASDPQERPEASHVRNTMTTITPQGLLSNVSASG